MYSFILMRYLNIPKSLRIFPKVYSVLSYHELKVAVPNSSQVRMFWDTFPFLRPLYHEKDGLDKNKFDLIYHSGIFKYAFYAQCISIVAATSQIFGSSYYAIKSYLANEFIVMSRTIGPYSIHYDLLSLGIISILMIQNVLIFIAAQNVLLRAYYNEEDNIFVFVTLAKNPFKTQLMFCKPGSLIPMKEGVWNIIFGNHRNEERSFYIRCDNFKSVEYYNNLTNYRCQ